MFASDPRLQIKPFIYRGFFNFHPLTVSKTLQSR